jgi:hypothetical protein
MLVYSPLSKVLFAFESTVLGYAQASGGNSSSIWCVEVLSDSTDHVIKITLLVVEILGTYLFHSFNSFFPP